MCARAHNRDLIETFHHPLVTIGPDGNRISFTYSEDRSGYLFGWVEIGYRPSGALAAKKLQQELDEYLCERDFVRRVG